MESKPGDHDSSAQATGERIEKEEVKADAPTQAKQDPFPVEDMPDPDEDDLDDLDGL